MGAKKRVVPDFQVGDLVRSNLNELGVIYRITKVNDRTVDVVTNDEDAFTYGYVLKTDLELV